MLIFLYGEDSYRRNQKLNELIAAYKIKHDQIDVLALDLDDDAEDWLRAKDFLNQPSMFVDSKILIIKESGSVEEKEWIKILKKEGETAKTFVLISDAKKPKKPCEFLLKKPVQFQKFEELKGEELNLFLKQEQKKRNLIFSSSAEQYFYNHIAKQSEKSWTAINEFNKLFLANLPQPISIANLERAIASPTSEFSFRKTQNLFNEERVGRKLFLLEDLFLTKEDPAHLFNLLAYQATGGRALSLADYDVVVKSGRLDYEEVLLDFVISN